MKTFTYKLRHIEVCTCYSYNSADESVRGCKSPPSVSPSGILAVVTWLEQDWVEHVRKRQHIMLLGKQSRQENSATDEPRVHDGMDVTQIFIEHFSAFFVLVMRGNL